MKRPRFDVEATVKVVSKESPFYGKRGVVTALLAKDVNEPSHEVWFDVNLEKDKLRKAYGVDLEWMVDVNVEMDGEKKKHIMFSANSVETVQHKFVDIQAIRETDVDLGNGVFRSNNVGAFEVGDHIQISEKIDGANASIAWCPEDNCLEVFSDSALRRHCPTSHKDSEKKNKRHNNKHHSTQNSCRKYRIDILNFTDNSFEKLFKVIKDGEEYELLLENE